MEIKIWLDTGDGLDCWMDEYVQGWNCFITAVSNNSIPSADFPFKVTISTANRSFPFLLLFCFCLAHQMSRQFGLADCTSIGT